MRYRQCLLAKNGKSYQLAWIPAQLAITGKILRIKEDNGWKVEKVYSSAPEEYLSEYMANPHREWRDATDI